MVSPTFEHAEAEISGKVSGPPFSLLRDAFQTFQARSSENDLNLEERTRVDADRVVPFDVRARRVPLSFPSRRVPVRSEKEE